MTTHSSTYCAPLAVRVKEHSPGLFFWIVVQLSAQEHIRDVCIDRSDHPYLSHEAAMSVGMACLKAHQAAAHETFNHPPYLAPLRPAARF